MGGIVTSRKILEVGPPWGEFFPKILFVISIGKFEGVISRTQEKLCKQIFLRSGRRYDTRRTVFVETRDAVLIVLSDEDAHRCGEPSITGKLLNKETLRQGVWRGHGLELFIATAECMLYSRSTAGLKLRSSDV